MNSERRSHDVVAVTPPPPLFSDFVSPITDDKTGESLKPIPTRIRTKKRRSPSQSSSRAITPDPVKRFNPRREGLACLYQCLIKLTAQSPDGVVSWNDVRSLYRKEVSRHLNAEELNLICGTIKRTKHQLMTENLICLLETLDTKGQLVRIARTQNGSPIHLPSPLGSDDDSNSTRTSISRLASVESEDPNYEERRREITESLIKQGLLKAEKTLQLEEVVEEMESSFERKNEAEEQEVKMKEKVFERLMDTVQVISCKKEKVTEGVIETAKHDLMNIVEVTKEALEAVKKADEELYGLTINQDEIILEEQFTEEKNISTGAMIEADRASLPLLSSDDLSHESYELAYETNQDTLDNEDRLKEKVDIEENVSKVQVATETLEEPIKEKQKEEEELNDKKDSTESVYMMQIDEGKTRSSVESIMDEEFAKKWKNDTVNRLKLNSIPSIEITECSGEPEEFDNLIEPPSPRVEESESFEFVEETNETHDEINVEKNKSSPIPRRLSTDDLLENDTISDGEDDIPIPIPLQRTKRSTAEETPADYRKQAFKVSVDPSKISTQSVEDILPKKGRNSASGWKSLEDGSQTKNQPPSLAESEEKRKQVIDDKHDIKEPEDQENVENVIKGEVDNKDIKISTKVTEMNDVPPNQAAVIENNNSDPKDKEKEKGNDKEFKTMKKAESPFNDDWVMIDQSEISNEMVDDLTEVSSPANNDLPGNKKNTSIEASHEMSFKEETNSDDVPTISTNGSKASKVKEIAEDTTNEDTAKDTRRPEEKAEYSVSYEETTPIPPPRRHSKEDALTKPVDQQTSETIHISAASFSWSKETDFKPNEKEKGCIPEATESETSSQAETIKVDEIEEMRKAVLPDVIPNKENGKKMINIMIEEKPKDLTRSSDSSTSSTETTSTETTEYGSKTITKTVTCKIVDQTRVQTVELITQSLPPDFNVSIDFKEEKKKEEEELPPPQPVKKTVTLEVELMKLNEEYQELMDFFGDKQKATQTETVKPKNKVSDMVVTLSPNKEMDQREMPKKKLTKKKKKCRYCFCCF